LVNQQSSQTANSLVISQKLFDQPSQQENAIIHLINMYDAIYSVAMFFLFGVFELPFWLQ
jgi:hypothetical protein